MKHPIKIGAVNVLLGCVWSLCGGVYLPDAGEGDNLTVKDRAGIRDAYLGSRNAPGKVLPVRVAESRFGGKDRCALRFRGKGSYGTEVMSIPVEKKGVPFSVTIEAWFRPEKTPESFTRLICVGDSPEKRDGSFRLYTKKGGGADRVIWALNLNGKTYELGTPQNLTVFTPGKWVHIAATYQKENGIAKIFIDGKTAATASFPKGGITPTDHEITVGNRGQADRGFIGLIDEIRIEPEALDIPMLGFSRPLSALHKVSAAKTFEWEGSRCGITDQVPAPWKPVAVSRKADGRLTVTAAEKTFYFNRGILPDRILLRGNVELLASPFRAEWNGKALEAVPGTLRVLSESPREVRLAGELRYGALNFRGEVSIEFDGLSGVTLASLDQAAGAKVRSFRMKIELPRANTPLAKVGAYAGFLTKKLSKAWSFPMWAGGETCGMTLYAESDRWWVNPRPQDAFVLEPLDKTADLTVNFISASTVFKQDSSFTFFFQPTPVRDFPKSRPEMGFFHGAFYDMEKIPGAVNLAYDAADLLNREKGTLDILLEAAFDPGAKMERLLGREPYIREIFSVVTLGQEHFRLCYSIPHGGIIADEGIQPSSEAIWDGTRQTLFTGGFRPEKNRLFRLTLCWGEGKLRCFADGRLIGECERPSLFSARILPEIDGTTQIRFGESIFNFLTPRFGSGFRIAALRLLDRVLPPEKEDAGTLRPLEGTVLLERFRNVTALPGGALLCRPEMGPSGRVSRGGTLADGKLCLYQNPAEMKASCLDRVAETGTTAMIFHQGWSSIQSHYRAEEPGKLHQLIDACHKKGMKLLLYFGFELSEKAPEFAKWHREALRLHPDRPTPPLSQVRHDQKSGKVCYGSRWQDFITFAIEKTWKEFQFDGVFIDAAMVPYPCPNDLHGCGWRDSAGKLHATMPVHRYLEMIRRIHHIVKSRGGLITGNQASGPLWGYPDSVWVGEGYKYKELAANPGKAIPLPEWRTNFAGRTIGTPGELLLYEYPPFWRRDAGWALAGLHGMFLRPESWWKGSYLEKLARMRRVFREFGMEQAEYIAYYDPSLPVKSAVKDVAVTLYRTPQALLLWIANLSAEEKVAPLSFGSSLPSGTRIADPLTGAVCPLKENSIQVRVYPYNWRMLRIDLPEHKGKELAK